MKPKRAVLDFLARYPIAVLFTTGGLLWGMPECAHAL
jgi:hypothetical protein